VEDLGNGELNSFWQDVWLGGGSAFNFFLIAKYQKKIMGDLGNWSCDTCVGVLGNRYFFGQACFAGLGKIWQDILMATL